jgi:hypothetical protein
MFISIGKKGELTLSDHSNFRAFKIVDESGRDLAGLRAALGDIANIVDDKTAWVKRDAVPSLLGEALTPEWLKAYSSMLEKAAPYGWIDPESGAVKAHIEAMGK